MGQGEKRERKKKKKKKKKHKKKKKRHRKDGREKKNKQERKKKKKKKKKRNAPKKKQSVADWTAEKKKISRREGKTTPARTLMKSCPSSVFSFSMMRRETSLGERIYYSSLKNSEDGTFSSSSQGRSTWWRCDQR